MCHFDDLREFAVNSTTAGYASTIVGSPYDWLLIHRQLPIGSNFIMAKYVQVPVTASDLEVTIVNAVPLIDVLGDFDLAAIETNSVDLLDAILVHIGLCLDLHGVLLHSSRRARANADDHAPSTRQFCGLSSEARGRANEVTLC